MRNRLPAAATWNPLLAFVLICALPGTAGANGGFWDSAHRVTGNLYVPSTRFALRAETLDIRLHALDYEVSITYMLDDSQTSPAGKAVSMIFPVVCALQDDTATPGTKGCLKDVAVRADGQQLPTRMMSRAESKAIKALAPLSEKLTTRSMRILAINPDDDESGSKYAYFSFMLPADRHISTLSIDYAAPYFQNAGGTSKRPDTTYGPASLVYDFLPAAAWAGHDVAQLDIHVDASGLQSALSFNAKRWPFARQGTKASLSIQHPDFSKLPPLVLQTQNGNYQNYNEFAKRLSDSKVRYQVTVLRAEPSTQGFNDPAALTDRKPDTFWCWRGPKASLQLTTDTGAIGKAENQLFYMHLWGMALLPGAVRDKATYERFGSPARISIFPLSRKVTPHTNTLPVMPMATEQDRFASFTILDDENMIEEIPAEINDSDLKPSDRRYIRQHSLRIEITGAHTRQGSDENCISEILPAYL